MTDEMDLLTNLRDTEPVRPHAYEEARGALRAAMATQAVPEPRTVRGRQARWGARRKVGIGAVALVAASAATALAVTSIAPSGGTSAQPGTVTVTATANPILTQLVADISPLKPDAKGNATLTVRNKSRTSDQITDWGIDLRTDSGTYYWGVEKSSLRKAVAEKRGGDDHYKRNIAIARYALKGDMDTARARMSVAHLLPGSPPEDGTLTPDDVRILKEKAKAAGKKYVSPKPKTPAEKKEIIDNRIWMNTADALVAAPGDPQVRAGALRILATMPNVKVAKTTTAGRPTLTLTDRWTIGADSVEKLVIDARTGQPISMFSGGSDMKSVTIYYHNTRVKIADIATGKF
ncbi:hypothetical protein GCM10022254_48010 [Actinomadura meridiana]|uniref:CU044_5270 family protein n=1 Tax=Actinomadura meridiana TaxID=559626 RepID=A0ABP8CBD8_9ACTN